MTVEWGQIRKDAQEAARALQPDELTPAQLFLLRDQVDAVLAVVASAGREWTDPRHTSLGPKSPSYWTLTLGVLS